MNNHKTGFVTIHPDWVMRFKMKWRLARQAYAKVSYADYDRLLAYWKEANGWNFHDIRKEDGHHVAMLYGIGQFMGVRDPE
jgi:hypothetical protein